jgi:hypothetical protein
MKTTIEHFGEHTKEELEAMIKAMRAVSSAFYAGASRTRCHAFIEFCGLMSKYLDICELACQAGIDFTTANVHGDKTIPIEAHDLQYLAEKFECIFSGLLSTPEQKKLFVKFAGLDD